MINSQTARKLSLSMPRWDKERLIDRLERARMVLLVHGALAPRESDAVRLRIEEGYARHKRQLAGKDTP